MKYLFMSIVLSSAAHADLPSFFQPLNCESWVDSTRQVEAILSRLLNHVMAAVPEETDLPPFSTAPALNALLEAESEMSVQLSLEALSTVNYINLKRVRTKIQPKLKAPPRILDNLADMNNFRGNMTNLIGEIYEALVTNRLRSLNPAIGRTVGRLYRRPNWTRAESDKEIDLVMRSGQAADIWVETKFFPREMKPQHHIYVDRLLEQVGKMVRLKNAIDPAIKIYMITQNNLDDRVLKQISDLGVQWIHFSIAGQE